MASTEELTIRDAEMPTNWRSVYIVTVVAVIGTVELAIVGPVLWPYLQQLDTNLNEGFLGILNTISSVAGIFSSIACGYVVNLLLNTKGPMVASKLLAVVSCAIYLSVELWGLAGRKVTLILFEIVLGMSVGASNVYRAHLSDVSTEKDRAKAVAISTLSSSLATLFSPIIQFAFQPLGYPGASFLFGTHLNVFTAPILFMLIVCVGGLVILLMLFDGRMLSARKRNEQAIREQSLEDSESSSTVEASTASLVQQLRCDGCSGFDWIAVVVCWSTRILAQIMNVTFSNAITLYTILAFGWTTEQTVLYQSIFMGVVGICGLALNVAYIVFNLRDRLHERWACLLSLCIFLAIFLASFPWPFWPTVVSDASPECRQRFTWCDATTVANGVLFFGAFGVAMGVAQPLILINLDSLHSKILGPIPQGTMQGMYSAVGNFVSIFGPIVTTQVYTRSGPTPIWAFVSSLAAVCVALWIVFFRRMISFSERRVS